MITGWLLLAAPCVIVVACIRSAVEGGWKRIVRLLLVMAATAFLTWMVGDYRLQLWKSKQGMHNRMNVCMIHDNLTALMDMGDEREMREYVGFFGTNGCTLLNWEQMQTARGKGLQERHLDWCMRIREPKDRAGQK